MSLSVPVPFPAPPAPALALQRLLEGNRRFMTRTGRTPSLLWEAETGAPQRPFAVVLGCSDSRMPVELLFDQGFGDLFVVRVAGNIVAPSLVGSVEFAVSQFGTRLVVVLGHSQCGAVGATVDALLTGAGPSSENIRSITGWIAPHVVRHVSQGVNRAQIVRDAIAANIRASVAQLKQASSLLENLSASGSIAIVGAEYSLETGEVALLEGGHGVLQRAHESALTP